MTGFQIPGLGKAVPNEVLPPLSSLSHPQPATQSQHASRDEPTKLPHAQAEQQFSAIEAEQARVTENTLQAKPPKVSEELRRQTHPLAEGGQRTNQPEETPHDADALPPQKPEIVPNDERSLMGSSQADAMDKNGDKAVTEPAGLSPAAGGLTGPSQGGSRGDASAESGRQEIMTLDEKQDQGVMRHEDSRDMPAEPSQAADGTTSEPLKEQIQTNPHDDAPADPMAVDLPESPPCLTGALLAAIGELGPATGSAENQQASNEAPQTAPALQNDESEHPEWEIDSAPYESSDSSSSDSSDSESDNEAYELLGIDETVRLLMETEGGSDDEGGKGATVTSTRTKNELPDEVIPRPDVTVTPEMKLEALGVVEHIVEGNIVVKAFTPGEYQVLDSGSVLCTANRVVIGAVAETLGKVLQPMYTVRFNSEDEVRGFGVEVGTKIFYPVDLASYVFTEPLKGLKGSDASNINDEEVAADEMEFSDDEKEAEHKRALKSKNRNKRKDNRGGPHPLRQTYTMPPRGSLNYDDEAGGGGNGDVGNDDGPYRPLSRPPDFGSSSATYEPVEAAPRAQPQRNGRRNDRRGNRGGRGRDRPSRDQPGDRRRSTEGFSLPSQGFQQQRPPQATSNGPWAPPAHSAPVPQTPAAPAPSAPVSNWQPPQSQWPMQPLAHLAHGMPAPPPPPPPNWPSQPAVQGQQAANGGTFVNPALIAALMSHLQSQGGGQQWTGQAAPQWQQPPPPGGWS
ncbi:H/ACA ribonucleoprotein complex, subunit Gar1/Naf1 [Ophiocordyceps camponoti-floridani]|uniref:H/ACA ribonucleoprotein complex non-core subunit NAF1 n=1 Tax=Ophiocordyceps camponoti-floridani TaxID=2030778 RepID=A0A8H4QBC5_9HYPO|nr:H/ACA ribonucleoprotein complex, subunit Gar1/Naf1 [Ophiocordyceps camponoti-floridani]